MVFTDDGTNRPPWESVCFWVNQAGSYRVWVCHRTDDPAAGLFETNYGGKSQFLDRADRLTLSEDLPLEQGDYRIAVLPGSG
ncbi:MAG: hypothetical protein J07HR59_00935 [Halorubrum sp. J07HR59]|nr:MAG: hypothetical protein J07HR59_00935 [Halorubrum sp. J07HR59]